MSTTKPINSPVFKLPNPSEQLVLLALAENYSSMKTRRAIEQTDSANLHGLPESMGTPLIALQREGWIFSDGKPKEYGLTARGRLIVDLLKTLGLRK